MLVGRQGVVKVLGGTGGGGQVDASALGDPLFSVAYHAPPLVASAEFVASGDAARLRLPERTLPQI